MHIAHVGFSAFDERSVKHVDVIGLMDDSAGTTTSFVVFSTSTFLDIFTLFLILAGAAAGAAKAAAAEISFAIKGSDILLQLWTRWLRWPIQFFSSTKS